jgi:hypothetical protein
VAALLALAAGLTGCSAAEPSADDAPASSAAQRGPAPALVAATLSDKVNAANGTWSTTWQACFATGPGGGSVAWQAQTLTSEGAVPGVDSLDDECLELQVATGVGDPADDPTREASLADAVRLVYQVRVVHPDGTVSPWSEPVAAGTER